ESNLRRQRLKVRLRPSEVADHGGYAAARPISRLRALALTKRGEHAVVDMRVDEPRQNVAALSVDYLVHRGVRPVVAQLHHTPITHDQRAADGAHLGHHKATVDDVEPVCHHSGLDNRWYSVTSTPSGSRMRNDR